MLTANDKDVDEAEEGNPVAETETRDSPFSRGVGGEEIGRSPERSCDAMRCG